MFAFGRFLYPAPAVTYDRNTYMFAIIGNVVAGILALSLFTATVRISR